VTDAVNTDFFGTALICKEVKLLSFLLQLVVMFSCFADFGDLGDSEWREEEAEDGGRNFGAS